MSSSKVPLTLKEQHEKYEAEQKKLAEMMKSIIAKYKNKKGEEKSPSKKTSGGRRKQSRRIKNKQKRRTHRHSK